MTVSTHQDPDQFALAGCGQRLRLAREAAGLSVDEVATRLHMPTRVVRSLEAEDWSRLGAPVFVRGQVRSYSRLLGLMTAPMMDALNVAQIEPAQLVSRTHTPKAQWWAEQIGRRLVYIVLTLSLAIPAWVATRQHLSGTPVGVAALDTPVEHAADPAAARTPRAVVASMAPVSVGESAAMPVAAPAPAPVTSEAAIVLKASGASWLEVIGKDGRTLEKGMLKTGDLRRYDAAQLKSITIGNASAVILEDRGEPVSAMTHARANVARFAVSSDGSLVAAN